MDGCNSIKIFTALLLGLMAAVNCLPHPQDTNVNNIRSSYRTSKTPKCASQHHSPNAPCENDPEYDVHIKARFSKILDNQPIDQLLQEMMALGLDTSHVSASRGRRMVENREISFPSDGVKPDIAATDFALTSSTTDFVEESAACQSVKSTIYPKRGKNKSDEWVFIMNQEVERQGVTVETCYDEGSSCNLGDVIPGIQTTCRQKYIYKTFLVMGQGEKVVPEEILMPSTCVCYVRRN